MADQRVNGNLVLIGSLGGTIALGCQASGGGFTILLPTNIPQVGQSLVITSVYNGNTATAQWGIQASGTVTSIGLTAPSIFTVSGQPVTQSGVIALGLATQGANTFFAGPTSGGAAIPTFRSMVLSDLPVTGTPSTSTFLRGDGTWSVVPIIATYVQTFNGRSGVVTAQSGDYTYSQISSTPQLPITPVVPSHEWLNGYSSTSGVFSFSQPASTDLSDSAALARIASPTFTGTVTLPAVSVTGALTYTTANPTFNSSTGSGQVVLATSPTLTSASLAGTTSITNAHITGTLADGTNSVGTSGQVLTSTVTGVHWSSGTSPQNTPAVTHEWLNSYNSTTGAFTQTQPSVSDLSTATTGTGSIVLAAGPSLTGTTSVVNLSLTGTFADDTSSVGTNGQVLTSTATGTLWFTPTVAFTNVTNGTNTTATMTVGTGGTLTFSGSGVVNANEVYGVVISSTPPTGAGQVLTSTSSSAAQWSTPTASGAVNSGTGGQLTWYATTGTAVSGNANATISSGALTLGQAGSVAGALVFSGTDVGGTSTVTVTVDSSSFTAWTLTLPTDHGTSGYVLETDGAGKTSWVAQGGGGGGSVTAFSSGDFSPLFTTSVANPTTTPALSFTTVNQSANVVYAGPTSGGSAAPTFRALVDGDLPGGVTGTGAVVLANAPTFTANPTFASSTGSGAVVLAVGPTLSGVATVADISITGSLTDNDSSTGTSGYVLTAGTGGQVVWAPAAFSGSIAATQIAFGSGTNTITGSANFTWDNTSHVLTGLDGYLDQVTGTTSIAFDNAVSAHGNLSPHTSVTGTPTLPNEWALTVTVPTHPYIYDSAFQVLDDTNLLLLAAKPLTDTSAVTFDTGGSGFPWASIIAFFRNTPNLEQVVGQTPGSLNWTFPYTTLAGDTICVALGGVANNITAVSVTDTQGNNYVQQGYALQTGTAYVFLFVAEGTVPLVAGVDSITGVYTGGASEDITLLELAPAGATYALASNNVIVTSNSGLGGTHITDLGGGGVAINASGDNNYLSLSSSDIGGTLVHDSGGTGLELKVDGPAAVYTITSVDVTDGVHAVYHGIFPIFNLAGTSITISGFSNGVNNITDIAFASTRYTLVMPNTSAIAEAAAATGTNNAGGVLNLSSLGALSLTAFAGTANPMLLPTTTGTAGYVLSTDGGSPVQQLTWIAAGGGGGSIGGTIAANQIAFGTASNTIGGDSNFTWTEGTTALVVNTAGGALFTDSGSAGISLDSTAGFGGGIQLTSAGAGINWFTSSASGGSYITDQGSTGIFLLTETSAGGGIDLQTRGANGFITLDSQGNGGTTIQDSGGTTGITIEVTSTSSGAGLFLSNSDNGGTFIDDTGGGGIGITSHSGTGDTYLDASGGTGKLSFYTNATGGLNISHAGGTLTPGVNVALSISPTHITTIDGIVTVLNSASDERLKTGIQPFARGLAAITAITPSTYQWNETGQKMMGLPADFAQVGFIAQDVQKVIPEAVGKDGEYLSLDTLAILAALVNAVKELAAENKSLQERIMKLEKK